MTALTLARAAGVPVTMLGGGSNVLVADRGVRGLVIHPRGGDVALAGQLGPGDTIAFVVCAEREAIAALIAQERVLLRVESPHAHSETVEGRARPDAHGSTLRRARGSS